ncbi:hypothetical protein CBA19CS11_06010 [Caballeronia novacaledonica]|uniref:NMCC_0638 family (lipo)protein n=1 Tax=Caballeronia novacaledonica TaxID=1544861 RepID=UPI001EE2A124|nr:hypothetical protein [Caballeronia novacaledonica]GJH08362.1 hypothetical protein CBA19CS11_06010 [Caballeronia novacaledonica]
MRNEPLPNVEHRRCALALALIATFAASNAQSSPTQDDPRSNAATRLFLEVCANNIGDERKVRAWVADRGLQALAPALAEKVLQGKAGEVWSASNGIGDFLIVAQSPQQCSVWARKANTRISFEQFQKYVHDVERPGLTVSLHSDREVEAKDGRYRVVAYTIARENAGSAFLLEAITLDAPTAQVQVRLKFAQVKLPE